MKSADYEELAKLAHWLKGSGGNVGYDGFTQLAASLEASAKAQDESQALADLKAVEDYAGRVNAGWESLTPLAKSA